MLEHGDTSAREFLDQLSRARVHSRCPCGCASINFTIDGCLPTETDLEVVADFEFGDEAQLCGAFIFKKGGLLAGLEVYGIAVDAPKDLPDIAALRPLRTT